MKLHRKSYIYNTTKICTHIGIVWNQCDFFQMLCGETAFFSNLYKDIINFMGTLTSTPYFMFMVSTTM